MNTGATSRSAPSMYCRSRCADAGSSGNSSTIGRMHRACPCACASTPGRVEVRHQRELQLREAARDLDGLVVERPRHPVRAASRGSRLWLDEQAERGPALVDPGVGRALEAADVVAPEAEAAEREREPAAQGLGHRLEGRRRVAAPVHGHALAADGRRAGEERRRRPRRAPPRAPRTRPGCRAACSSCACAPGRSRRARRRRSGCARRSRS